MEIKTAEFITSMSVYTQPSPALPQIAVAGKSNVGKSSLINCLCRRKALAKTSATPGKTRLINFFEINGSFYLVDLPGYGFAAASKKEQRSWGDMIEGYLSGSPNLKHLLLLLDIRRTPNEDDVRMAYYLQHYRIPCTIIATKADKLPRSQRKLTADTFSDALKMTFRTPTLLFSSEEKLGVRELEARLGEILAGENA